MIYNLGMDGVWAPALLAGMVLIPLVPVFFWFRLKKYGSLRFFLALAAGIFSVAAAGLRQVFFPADLPSQDRMGELLFHVFVRVSLVEELGRLLVLFLLFHFIPYSRIILKKESPSAAKLRAVPFFGAPSGLAAGLGFAAAESVFYGLETFAVVFLRLVTAVPLHAACGVRAGNALCQAKSHPANALLSFFTAVLIHGVYNFCILNPGVPWFLPALIALSALASSLVGVCFADPAGQRL